MTLSSSYNYVHVMFFFFFWHSTLKITEHDQFLIIPLVLTFLAIELVQVPAEIPTIFIYLFYSDIKLSTLR